MHLNMSNVILNFVIIVHINLLCHVVNYYGSGIMSYLEFCYKYVYCVLIKNINRAFKECMKINTMDEV